MRSPGCGTRFTNRITLEASRVLWENNWRLRVNDVYLPFRDVTREEDACDGVHLNVDNFTHQSRLPQARGWGTWFKVLLDPLRGPFWTGNSVLLGSTTPDRDTSVAWGVFFKRVVSQKKKIEMVLRDPESIFFTFSYVFCHFSRPFSHSEIVDLA